MNWTHKELCDIGVKWLKRHSNGMGCQFAVSEIQSGYKGEVVDVFGYRCNPPNYGSFMVEVKTSRPDFLKDLSKPHRLNPSMGVGRYRIYLCPENVIQLDDIPPGWGLVWVNSRGHIKPQSLDMIECNVRNHDGEGYIMARLLSRVGDVEQMNKTLKEQSALSSKAWREVEKLEKKNDALTKRLVEISEKYEWFI